MSEEQDRRSSEAAEDVPSLQDEEPTLETDKRQSEAEQTLETGSQDWADEREDSQSETPSGSGRSSRLERMTAARRARRRRLVGRFWLVAVPILILVGIAMILLALYGGQRGSDSGSVTTVTTPSPAAEGSALLLVEDDSRLILAVLVHPWERGGVVLTIPGATLLETGGAFRELRETYETGGAEAVKASLAGAFEMPIGPAAVMDWSELDETLGIVVADDSTIEKIVLEQGETVSQVLRDSVAGQGIGGSSNGWSELSLQGDKTGFLAAIAVDSVSMTADVWSAGALRGTMVEGDGFSYLEPDLESARALLFVNEEPVVVSVEIRDGAGVEGAARAAGSLFEASGFELAPMSYAEGYPGVQTTRILVSAESMAEAQQVRSLLGVGEIVVDSTLAANWIMVVLGEDYEVPAVTTTTLATGGGG